MYKRTLWKERESTSYEEGREERKGIKRGGKRKWHSFDPKLETTKTILEALIYVIPQRDGKKKGDGRRNKRKPSVWINVCPPHSLDRAVPCHQSYRPKRSTRSVSTSCISAKSTCKSVFLSFLPTLTID